MKRQHKPAITDLTQNKVTETSVKDFSKENQPDMKKKSDSWFLRFTIVIGMLTWIVGGAKVVWTSPSLIKLESTDLEINPLGRPITSSEVSLLFGIPGMVSLPGSVIFPKLADILGRKICIIVIGFMMMISLLGLAFSNTIVLIILFSTICSISFVGTLGVLPMYLTEICEDHNRAKYGCILSLCIPLGQLYAYVLGPLLLIRDYTLVIAAPLLPFILFFFYVPESPVYLLSKGRDEECRLALEKLRSNKAKSELEVDYRHMSQSLAPTGESKPFKVLKVFTTKEGRCGLFLSSLGMAVQTFGGGATLLPLLAPIYENADSNLSGDAIAIIVEAVSILSLILTVFIIEKVGRRPLLIISAIGCGIPLIFMGLFFYFQHVGSHLTQQFHWVPLTSILVYFFMYFLGLGSIPFTMVSLFFNIELRSTGTAIVITFSCLLLTIFQSSFPLLAEAAGTHWCMWCFSILTFIGAVLMYMFLPETTGKSVEEIQKMLLEC
ncbi:facilitated trehalose transporter Tret1-like [Diorhabda sublineata]|uniref:facilitated trehalose transporter Tret1-like n=1 Tax=Diorhabda sublineata TaxID=1163346 RepID=UPI0024E0A9C1|nr:facilitated trehalose transporter Tret1-like [Diorhabda sublineata]XP_056641225.1 facilitated trehalose transporter Tret1-like [Diorhabda sublineata]XP_056641226.1 facilitated trehalose transporter Tret1-like [Diorhabda sublineata]XP_056641227.1 facilitated trehalose transporter Tret1-like [Diorhabda sublineata]XP_056641228.1 facilitated trehalose transporter Tret1-like [Diorhabda sublineata]XP_056641229.1 facilitated trehalose transporter Tret1-like [Diorhabda sublineata]XP_056641230.1 fa